MAHGPHQEPGHAIFLNSLCVVDWALVYRIENQACASWGIRVADLGLADPPTVFCEGYGDGMLWRPFLRSFSLAAVEMVLSESLVGRAGCHANRPPDYPAWWQPEVPQAVRWFGGPGALFREDSRTWLWVLARNAASLARIRHALPGEWQDTMAGRRLQ